MRTGAKVVWGVIAAWALFLTLLLVLEFTGTWDRSSPATPDPAPAEVYTEATECADPAAAVGEGWINCEVQHEIDPPSRYEMYVAHMRDHVPGATDWPAEWARTFAADVCEAFETWDLEDPAPEIVRALIEQWDWRSEHAWIAVSVAAQYACSDRAPETWGRK